MLWSEETERSFLTTHVIPQAYQKTASENEAQVSRYMGAELQDQKQCYKIRICIRQSHYVMFKYIKIGEDLFWKT
jgi:hypothetical protein